MYFRILHSTSEEVSGLNNNTRCILFFVSFYYFYLIYVAEKRNEKVGNHSSCSSLIEAIIEEISFIVGRRIGSCAQHAVIRFSRLDGSFGIILDNSF